MDKLIKIVNLMPNAQSVDVRFWYNGKRYGYYSGDVFGLVVKWAAEAEESDEMARRTDETEEAEVTEIKAVHSTIIISCNAPEWFREEQKRREET